VQTSSREESRSGAVNRIYPFGESHKRLPGSPSVAGMQRQGTGACRNMREEAPPNEM